MVPAGPVPATVIGHRTPLLIPGRGDPAMTRARLPGSRRGGPGAGCRAPTGSRSPGGRSRGRHSRRPGPAPARASVPRRRLLPPCLPRHCGTSRIRRPSTPRRHDGRVRSSRPAPVPVLLDPELRTPRRPGRPRDVGAPRPGRRTLVLRAAVRTAATVDPVPPEGPPGGRPRRPRPPVVATVVIGRPTSTGTAGDRPELAPRPVDPGPADHRDRRGRLRTGAAAAATGGWCRFPC